MDSAASDNGSIEASKAETEAVNSDVGKGMAEETKKRSVTPLQNIVNQDDLAPPTKKARAKTDNESAESEDLYAGEVEGDKEKPMAMLTADNVKFTSPENIFNVIIYKENIILKGEDGVEQHTIPIDSVGRIFVLPQEHHIFVALALIDPLTVDDSAISYVVLELPKEKEATASQSNTEDPKQLEEICRPMGNTATEPLAGALPKLIASLTGLDLEKSVMKSNPSMVLSVACKHNKESGYVFPLKDGFFFLHKSPLHLAFSDVSKAEFVKSKDSEELSDLVVTLKDGATIAFSEIATNEYQRLDVFGIEKGIAEGGKRLRRELPSGVNLVAGEDDEDSDDDDFHEDWAKVKGKEGFDDSGSESEPNSEPREEYESNVEDTTQEEMEVGEEENQKDEGEERKCEKEIVKLVDKRNEGESENAKAIEEIQDTDLQQSVEEKEGNEKEVNGAVEQSGTHSEHVEQEQQDENEGFERVAKEDRKNDSSNEGEKGDEEKNCCGIETETENGAKEETLQQNA